MSNVPPAIRDHVRAGRRAKRKGERGELEVRDLLREHGWQDSHRQFQSGGQGGGDLADAIPDVHLEVKNVERLDLPGAWRQANAAARPTDSILVASRANFQPWLGTLRLMDVLGWDVPGAAPLVITPRQSVRAEFMSHHRSHAHPLLVHTVCSEAVVTALLDDVLTRLAGTNQRPERTIR